VLNLNNKLIFLHSPKAGGSYTYDTLVKVATKSNCPIIEAYAFHEPERIYDPNVTYVINIRNPWDWYVSIWTYSSLNTLIFTESSKDRYGADVTFDDFIYDMHYNKVALAHHKGMTPNLWENTPITFGCQTYKLIVLLNYEELRELVYAQDWTNIYKLFTDTMNKPNVHVLRQERLTEDVFYLLHKYSRTVGFKTDVIMAEQQKHLKFSENFRKTENKEYKINKRDEYKEYYKLDSSKALVELSERPLIDLYKYSY